MPKKFLRRGTALSQTPPLLGMGHHAQTLPSRRLWLLDSAPLARRRRLRRRSLGAFGASVLFPTTFFLIRPLVANTITIFLALKSLIRPQHCKLAGAASTDVDMVFVASKFHVRDSVQ